MPGTQTACFCPEHIDGTSIQDGDHTFERERDYDKIRWKCSCGKAGQWGAMDTLPYHRWAEHVKRAGGEA
jgi:hypothetical protein